MVGPILLTTNPPGWVEALVEALTTRERLKRHFFASSDMVSPEVEGTTPLQARETAYMSAHLFSPLGGHYWLHCLRPSIEPFCDTSDEQQSWRVQAKKAPLNESFHQNYLVGLQAVASDEQLCHALETPDFFGMRILDYAKLLGHQALVSQLKLDHQRLLIADDSAAQIARSQRIQAGLTRKTIEWSDLYQGLVAIRNATGLNIDTMLHANDPVRVKTALGSFHRALYAHYS